MNKVTKSKIVPNRTRSVSNDLNLGISMSRIENISNEICKIKDLIALLRKDFDSSEDRKNGNKY